MSNTNIEKNNSVYVSKMQDKLMENALNQSKNNIVDTIHSLSESITNTKEPNIPIKSDIQTNNVFDIYSYFSNNTLMWIIIAVVFICVIYYIYKYCYGPNDNDKKNNVENSIDKINKNDDKTNDNNTEDSSTELSDFESDSDSKSELKSK